MTIKSVDDARFDGQAQVLIVGAGAAGLVAAISARELGAEVIVLERDALPRGSTALSSGLLPAAGTQLQREAGVQDSPAQLAADIQKKCDGQADEVVVDALSTVIGPVIDWLSVSHGVPFVLVDGFAYPGHSVRRMHGLPRRTGQEMMDHLHRAAEAAGADILTSVKVDALYWNGSRICGVHVVRPDGSGEDIACSALILACSGFGGNAAMVGEYLPGIGNAVFLGHHGNEGHGIEWGKALGAELRHMGAFQGHGSVAIPHNIGITWAIMVSGGIQVNTLGQRFANEHRGYSEQAADVLRQPGAVAFDIFDARCHQVAMGFDHYREAFKAGAVRLAATLPELEQQLDLAPGSLEKTMQLVNTYAAGTASDPLGRDFTKQPTLVPPYHAVRVTGGLYHTQGGLRVDAEGRVLGAQGPILSNLFAAGGTACGVSGSADAGYLAGNGLLSAIGLGFLSGQAAARLVTAPGVAAAH